MQLISTSLRTLSLVGYWAMTNIQLACPNLQHVYLDGCDHFEGASFCPVRLQSLNLGICLYLSKTWYWSSSDDSFGAERMWHPLSSHNKLHPAAVPWCIVSQQTLGWLLDCHSSFLSHDSVIDFDVQPIYWIQWPFSFKVTFQFGTARFNIHLFDKSAACPSEL